MLFNFGPPGELLTPIAIDGSVRKSTPFFTSNDISPAADVNLYSSSVQSKKDELDLRTLDKHQQINDRQLYDDLFSSFDVSDLNDFGSSELSIDDFPADKYLSQSSFASIPLDMEMSSFAEKSIVLPALDSTLNLNSEDSSMLPWVGEECTIGSCTDEDVEVPLDSPMPSVFSPASSSSSAATTGASKNHRLSTLERRLRKKDQNKTAAEKYRLKKRTERDELLQRKSDLANQNRELKFELENQTFRLNQFKQLFVDVLQIPVPSSKSK